MVQLHNRLIADKNKKLDPSKLKKFQWINQMYYTINILVHERDHWPEFGQDAGARSRCLKVLREWNNLYLGKELEWILESTKKNYMKQISGTKTFVVYLHSFTFLNVKRLSTKKGDNEIGFSL